MERVTLHIVGGDSRSRAEQARIVFSLGHHAEVYVDVDELLERSPKRGIIIAINEGQADETSGLIYRLGSSGVWLPLIVASFKPTVEQIVDAIRAGALDFIELPLELGGFARRLSQMASEAARSSQKRRRHVEARRTIETLSPREREVLALLSAGCSNKQIAQNLSISPRTVEIHRGNMMNKLDAGHAADAVRLWLEANQDITSREVLEEGPVTNAKFRFGQGINERYQRERLAPRSRRA